MKTMEKNNRKMQENGKQTDRPRRNDILLIGGIVIAAGVLLLVIWLVFFQEGTTAVVSLNGNVILEQPLSEDCRIPIQTKEGSNIFQIENGIVSVVEADCRDQICVKHAGISRNGESIVCLPHKLVIEIRK